MTPMQRSLAKMRQDGYCAEITEHWNQWSKTRHDLFNCIDILCVNGKEVVGIQTTSGTNVASHVQKLRKNPILPLVLASGIRLEIHGWRPVKVKRGGRQMRWECRVIPVTPNLINPRDPNTPDIFDDGSSTCTSGENEGRIEVFSGD